MSKIIFRKETWFGDSRDGCLVNADGYHYFKMQEDGLIIDAYEVYENDDGTEVVTPMPEMKNVNWLTDLGFDDFETLDEVHELDFYRITKQNKKSDI